jgi:hypothetical protein
MLLPAHSSPCQPPSSQGWRGVILPRATFVPLPIFNSLAVIVRQIARAWRLYPWPSSGAHTVSVWETASMHKRGILKSAFPKIGTRHQHALAFSPRGDLLATAGWDEWLPIWDTFTGKRYSPRGPSPGIENSARLANSGLD